VNVEKNSAVALEAASWRTLPNVLTFLRILLIVPFGYYLVRADDLRALAIFVIAGITDTLDGNLARWLNQQSKLGRLLDPIADKLLTGVAYVIMALFRGAAPAMPVWVMIAVVARDVLILAGCAMVYSMVRDTSFKASIFGKLNTLLELGVIVAFLIAGFWPALGSALPAIYVVLLISILISFSDYLLQGVRMVRQHRV
jgi:cardiolipin synthase